MVFSKGQIRFSICLIWSKSVHIEQRERERVDGNPLKASASSWNGQELLLFDKVTGSTGCHFEGYIVGGRIFYASKQHSDMCHRPNSPVSLTDP